MTVAVILSGCVKRDPQPAAPTPAQTPAEYEAAVASWAGRSEADLIRAWGVPTHSQLLSQGGQALEYVQWQNGEVVCTTLFTSNLLGMLETWTWRGKRCRVPRLGGDDAAR
jgi:hypothetical protein